MIFAWAAVLESLGGVTWSITALIREGSQTRSMPLSIRSMMAMGVVISWHMMTSMSSTMLPGVGVSRRWAAKIFSVMVCPIDAAPEWGREGACGFPARRPAANVLEIWNNYTRRRGSSIFSSPPPDPGWRGNACTLSD